jgi:hypothetical protein
MTRCLLLKHRSCRSTALLDTAHRYDDLGAGGNQDGGVDDSVLLGAHKFLAVQDENHLPGTVDHPQLGYRPALAHLPDLD